LKTISITIIVLLLCFISFSQGSKRGTITVSKAKINKEVSDITIQNTSFNYDTLSYFKSEIIGTISEFNKTPDGFSLNILLGGNKSVPKIESSQSIRKFEHKNHYYFFKDSIFIIQSNKKNRFLDRWVKKRQNDRDKIIKKLSKKQSKKKLEYVGVSVHWRFSWKQEIKKRVYNNSYINSLYANAGLLDDVTKNLRYSSDSSQKTTDTIHERVTYSKRAVIIFNDTIIGSNQMMSNSNISDTINFLLSICSQLENKMFKHYKAGKRIKKMQWEIKKTPLLEANKELEIYNSNGESFICKYEETSDSLHIINPPMSIFDQAKIRKKRKRGRTVKEYHFKEERTLIKFKEIDF